MQVSNRAVMIPTQIYKCVYDPKQKESGCYLENNAPGDYFQIISIQQLEAYAGVNVFPSLPLSVKNRAMRLPSLLPNSKENSND